MAHTAPAGAPPDIPQPERPDISHVRSDELLETIAVIQQPITQARVREMQRWVKENWFWSAADLAQRLDCSRAHLKRIESGSRQPSEMFLVHFRQVERQRAAWKVEAQQAEPEHVILSKFPLPRRVLLPERLHVCRICGLHFPPKNNRQRRCSPDCLPKHHRRRKKK